MKNEHPSFDDIASYLDETVTARRRDEIGKHLNTCTRCDKIATRVRKVLQALRTDALTPAPTGLAEKALGAIREQRVPTLAERADSLLSRIAALVFDSNTRPAPAGVRGTVAPVRQLVYEWESDRFTIRVQREATGGTYEIRGQILLTEGRVDGLAVHLRPQSGRGRRTTSAITGEFAFEGVAPGAYSIRIASNGGDISLPGIELL